MAARSASLLVALFLSWMSPAATVPPLDGCDWVPSAPAASPQARFTVIDLWAPWSGESTGSLPTLSRLSREFAPKGVSIVSVTRAQPAFGEDRIRDTLRRLGGRATLPVAIAPAELFAALAALSGAESPPATLVADASGAVIAVCTPAELEHVLSRVIAGSWLGPHEVDSIRRESRAMDSLVTVSLGDPALAARQLDELMASHPHRTRDFASRRIAILLRAGRIDEASVAMRAATDEWTRLQDAAELTALATIWMDPGINASGRDMTMAAQAAESAALISGDLDPNPWLLLMRARVAAGDPSGARAAGERAMAMGDERMRARVARLIARIPAQPEGSSDGTGQRSTAP